MYERLLMIFIRRHRLSTFELALNGIVRRATYPLLVLTQPPSVGELKRTFFLIIYFVILVSIV